MKNLIKILLLLVMTAGLSSCEKIRSIFDVDFDTTLSGDLEIDIQDMEVLKSAEEYAFKDEVTVDPMDNEDIADYIDNIKKMDVNDVILSVEYVNKQDVIFKSGTYFRVANYTNEVTWTLSGDWPIVEGTEITLEDLGGTYDALEKILDTKVVFTISTEGTCTVTNVFIVIRLGIDTKVTASPL
jgi:hypothetical protein